MDDGRENAFEEPSRVTVQFSAEFQIVGTIIRFGTVGFYFKSRVVVCKKCGIDFENIYTFIHIFNCISKYWNCYNGKFQFFTNY